ncbi:DUF1501 domain-containing protein [Schlesneria sp. DSM 10557]|uniref:DUF1501 domain-containing protein n=1 Tax=Schlesneria sp. DSM 10557 TaxID=3044399 RepID=UPI0035A16D1B
MNHQSFRKYSRRDFLVASSVGLAVSSFGRTLSAASTPSSPGRKVAKSTILFFLCGGASHLDMWDLKPKAPLEYRGPFQPIATSAPGVQLSEHLPLLAQQAHHLALINSVGATVNTNDHHAGYYHNLTGHVPDPTFLIQGNNRTPYPDDWPYMGSVVASRRPQRPGLPNAVSLPYKPSQAPYTRPGQFGAKLGVKFDPLFVYGKNDNPTEFQAPDLALTTGVTSNRFSQRNGLLSGLDAARRDLDQFASVHTWNDQQQRAISLLSSAATTRAFDVSHEKPETIARYGKTVNGMSLLAARRLVEAGVPFVTVFWSEENDAVAKKCLSGGGWDTHGNNFGCLKEDLLPEFDRGFSALIEDLADRGLLDETLLMVTSEMGRTPKIGDPRSGGVKGAGRDHWTHCLTDVLAGGGIRGGQTFGSSDRLAEYPASRPVTPADVTKTVYHAMGIENLEAFDNQGRPFHLLEEGQPLIDLF